MRKKILFIFGLLVFNYSNSQIQRNFFVDDANGVDFIRFEFCVDNEAKITKAELIPELSTYKNQLIINQLKQYLLGLEFYPNSKLKNDCHKISFTLVNSKYENLEITQKEVPDDFELLKGRYQYKSPLYKETKIVRRKKVQREIGQDDKQIYRIKWLSDSKYELIYKRMTDKSLRKYIGKTINVEILEKFPDGSYVYKSTADHLNWVTYGMISKIN